MELITKYDPKNETISFSGFSNVEYAIDIGKKVEVAFNRVSFPEVCYLGFNLDEMVLNIVLFKEPSDERVKEIVNLALNCILFKSSQ